MWITQVFRFSHLIVPAALAATLTLSAVMPVFSQSPMLLRTIPFEVSGYSEAATLDQDTLNAEATYALLENSSPLIIHMEALRRAYEHYGTNTDERDKLLKLLKERYIGDQNNPVKFFDYGYAQLVLEGNKNGLFFLRKANDKISSPYTSLAYGIAQADIDILTENAAPDSLTTRKMDVTYKLKDALVFNKDDRLPGIWPSYVRILEGLKQYPAYDSLQAEDVTTIYVPYGIASLSREATAHQFLAISSPYESSDEQAVKEEPATPVVEVEATCPAESALPSWNSLTHSKSVDLDNDGSPESINFFQVPSSKEYAVKVLNVQNKIIGSFASYKAPYIVEDIDGDGKFELVVRQFDKDPYHPLYVYRWNGNCYAKDKAIASFFE